MRVQVSEYLENPPDWQVGIAFAKTRRNEPLLCARLGILFDAATIKRVISQEGAASFV